MTIDQSMEFLAPLGYTFEPAGYCTGLQFDVYLDGEIAEYSMSASNLQRMDCVVEMVAVSKFKQGFDACLKSMGEDISEFRL